MDLGSHADLSWVQDSYVGTNNRKLRNAALTYVFVPQMRFVFKGYAEIQDGDALSRFGYIEDLPGKLASYCDGIGAYVLALQLCRRFAFNYPEYVSLRVGYYAVCA